MRGGRIFKYSGSAQVQHLRKLNLALLTTMSKRNLSPALLPPSKRLHTLTGHQRLTTRLSFDNSFYDELILCIFSHLSWIDLCAAQATSKNWARLATDNELWRKLYLRTYGRARLRGTRGFVGRPDGRDIKPLPGRAKPEDRKDWKQMFRISSNWRRGKSTCFCRLAID